MRTASATQRPNDGAPPEIVHADVKQQVRGAGATVVEVTDALAARAPDSTIGAVPAAFRQQKPVHVERRDVRRLAQIETVGWSTSRSLCLSHATQPDSSRMRSPRERGGLDEHVHVAN